MSGTSSQPATSKPKKSFDIAVICAVCGALFSVLIFLFMLKQERDAVIQQFHVDMSQKTAQLDRQLAINLHSLESLQAYALMTEKIQPEGFQSTVKVIALRSPAVETMIWQPANAEALIVEVNGEHVPSELAALQALKPDTTTDSSIWTGTLGNNDSLKIVVGTKAHQDGDLITVIGFEALLKASGYSHTAGLSLKLIEGQNDQVLFSSGDSGAVAADAVISYSLNNPLPWVLSFAATEEYISERMGYTPALFLLTGLLLSFLFASYIKRMSRHLRSLRDEQEAMNQQLLETSWNDPLTGIANKKHFDEILEVECRRAVREFSPLTVMLVELDEFQPYMDHYGVDAAEQIIKQVATTLRESVGRPGDMVARVDDTRFALMLPSTNEQVTELASRCCECIVELDIEHELSSIGPILTVSIGVSTLQPSRFMTPDRVLETSMQQLAKAQCNGGNQYQALAEQSLEPSVTYSV